MPTWVPEVLQGLAGELLVAIIFAIGLMVWGKLKDKWSLPIAVFYGIVTFAAILYIFNHIGWEPTTKVKVHRWLDEASYSVRNLSDEKAAFNFEIRDLEGRLFYIRQPKDSPFIVFEVGHDVEHSFPKLNTLDRKSYERLIRHLRSEIAKHELHYVDFSYPLTRVRLSLAVPSSSLTRENFLQHFIRLRSGLIILVEEIGQVAG